MYPRACIRQMKKKSVFLCIVGCGMCEPEQIKKKANKRRDRGEKENRTRIERISLQAIKNHYLMCDCISKHFLCLSALCLPFLCLRCLVRGQCQRYTRRRLTNKFNGNKYAPCFPNYIDQVLVNSLDMRFCFAVKVCTMTTMMMMTTNKMMTLNKLFVSNRKCCEIENIVSLCRSSSFHFVFYRKN